jgi:glycosyltransferase involved in cell wall biosynthesis
MVKRGDPLLLSLLVPAYEFPLGIERILRQISRASSTARVEVLVADDSSTEGVRAVIERWRDRVPMIRYWRNRPALGAPRNWNHLLDEARGAYCCLFHHDEVPASPGFIDRILTHLDAPDPPDVLLARCVIVADLRTGRNRLHVPSWVRSAWLAAGTSKVLVRNVIGSTSTIVARRELYPRFDPELKWLVDVDAYYQLFRATRRVRLADDVVVVSSGDNAGSITRSLVDQLDAVKAAERRHMLSKYAGAAEVEGLLGATWRATLNRTLEWVFWAMVRSVTLVGARLSGPVLRPEELAAVIARPSSFPELGT